MSENKKQKGIFKSLAELSFVKKLKSIKHIEIIIVVIFILILLLICFSGNGMFGFLKTSTEVTTETSTTYTSTTEYVKTLEDKLENILSSIKDAGNVQVVISVDGSIEKTFATDETITTSGQKTEKQVNIILVEVNGKSEPLIVGEKLPEICGIVVVSSGASNTKVKLDIVNAIQTLFKIDASKIQVLIGK